MAVSVPDPTPRGSDEPVEVTVKSVFELKTNLSELLRDSAHDAPKSFVVKSLAVPVMSESMARPLRKKSASSYTP